MKLNSFNYLLKQGVNGIFKNKFMSFASFCIMLVSLLMIGLSLLTTYNVDRIIGNIEAKNEVVVVIDKNATEDQINALGNSLKTTSNISDVVFFAKDDAWKQMTENMSPEEQSLFQYSDSNPLPDTYKLRVSDISLMTKTTDSIASLAGVETVKVPTDFADLLVNLRSIGTLISSILLFSLAFICIVIVANTTRSSVFARRKEINIMKYVGATNNFIRFPFFIEGMVLGVLSAGGAFLITQYVYNAMFNTLSSNISIKTFLGSSSLVPFNQIFGYVALSYLVAGVVLGVFGTVSSTRKHLKV